MRYMLLIYNDEAAMANTPSEKTYQISAAYGAYTEALKKSGAWLAGDRLRPTQAATVVRTANGKTNVLDGPYADTKEQLAGFYMIEATDIDAAIEWSARCPAASTGTVEVRPIWEMTDYLSKAG
ncbi:YciI family protein [Mesorhizobium sp. M3A.F.Ca.ET.080.04.2.1]|uniref:YciI family protein n=1 Tax=Mesorhizobium sp. M3A.F.Ca.ET.080.04.2.1 TaxID=2493676 RepID=UPI000F74E3F4|nr:YciI family protein [Mesorhizobium sp. M3A.F.Ca.ET.080.04.2.1]AZO10464.1 YciI family protein [Mesorhizobium sp. M3A.F.Ca.ET.080.04.2.1]RWF22301.1 MAG: YciI family protein [Mesorhizobium sp.]